MLDCTRAGVTENGEEEKRSFVYTYGTEEPAEIKTFAANKSVSAVSDSYGPSRFSLYSQSLCTSASMNTYTLQSTFRVRWAIDRDNGVEAGRKMGIVMLERNTVIRQ